MALFARIFIKTTSGADVWMDMPVPTDLATLMFNVRSAGHMQTTDFYIPYDQIRFVATYVADMPESGKVFKLVPEAPKS